MKNIINEKPEENLVGRLRASMDFVNDIDVKDKKVLDIGCGFGSCVLNMLSRGVTQVVGLEITEEDLASAKKHINDTRASFVVGSAINLPFEDQSFDTVISWEVLEHIPKDTELKMFLEINRILKPRGIAYLSTPNNSFFSNILDPAWYFGHRHYTSEQLIRFAEASNFRIGTVNIKAGFFSLISALNMYVSKWIFRREPFWRELITKHEELDYKREGFVGIFITIRK